MQEPTRIQIDTLTVESFETEQGPDFMVGNAMECTGCVSGCGIFPNEPY
jgi:hypothetical protein